MSWFSAATDRWEFSMSSNLERSIFELAYGVAYLVFSPSYYKGKWYVYFRGMRRVCGNYTGAKAWAAYLQRRYGSWSANGISISKCYE